MDVEKNENSDRTNAERIHINEFGFDDNNIILKL